MWLLEKFYLLHNDPKTVHPFLAGISLPEPTTMTKSSTSSECCGTEGDAEDEGQRVRIYCLPTSYLMMIILTMNF